MFSQVLTSQYNELKCFLQELSYLHATVFMRHFLIGIVVTWQAWIFHKYLVKLQLPEYEITSSDTISTYCTHVEFAKQLIIFALYRAFCFWIAYCSFLNVFLFNLLCFTMSETSFYSFTFFIWSSNFPKTSLLYLIEKDTISEIRSDFYLQTSILGTLF